MGQRLLTFRNTHTVIRAERVLRKEGVGVEVVPTPKEISSECGMSLLVKYGDFERVLALLKGIEVTGVYEWDRE